MSGGLAIRERPSPNHNGRSGRAIRHLVLHYTGMQSGAEAEARLADPEAGVSAHYLLHEDGEIVRLVPDDLRAWHAGHSRWRGEDDLNSTSIGIELVNPGHEWGYRPFPEVQMRQLLRLLAELSVRHRIDRADVLGHSDVAPTRKTDPGELFDWGRLARRRLALARPTRLLADPLWTDGAFALALERFGYDVRDPVAAVAAFQRRFRQRRVDGIIDGESRAILLTLQVHEEARLQAKK